MSTMLASQLFGFKEWKEPEIVFSQYLTKKEKRTVMERLFSFPWKPLKKFKEVPDECVYIAGNKLIMHPYWKHIVEGYKKEKK